MGLVLILRWYWWRINAWSEISAMIAPLIIFPIAKYWFGMESPMTLYPIVIGTTIVWIFVTFITKPVEEEKLVEFYKRTRPGGRGWKRIESKMKNIKVENNGFGRLFVNWLLGVILIYSFLFGVGKIIFSEYITGTIFLIVGILCGIIINHNMKKQDSIILN